MLAPLNGAQLQFNGQDGLFDVNLQLLELEDIHEDMPFIEVVSAKPLFIPFDHAN
ncbi:hypothetical protein ACEQPO_15645 [Bacillus sp. SL00103]